MYKIDTFSGQKICLTILYLAGMLSRGNHFWSLFICWGVILVTFIAVSLLDIILVIFFPGFFSTIVVIITFGMGGVFAAVGGYMQAMETATLKTKRLQTDLIILLIVTGVLSFFLLSKLEGGEYEAPFKAFGATLALSSLLFVKGKVE